MANLRTPRQASNTFDLGGSQTPRPKGLFVVRFRRGASQGTSNWQRDLSFLVKSIEQPTISPKTEEINQYNKKRQIYTGYTTNPVSCVLYDTADGMALQMWNEYANFYFADFAQQETNYQYDATSPEMLGEDIGYGFSPAMNGSLGSESQFFFTALDIYQVFRNAYTKVTLVNPRISGFDPDDFDYEQMTPVTYRMTLSYEAVLYFAGGSPQPIDADAELASLFGDVRLHGDVIEVSGPPPAPLPGGGSNFVDSVGQKPLGGLGDVIGNVTSILGSSLGLSATQSGGLGGVLSSFGSFDFGAGVATAVSRAVSGNTRNLPAELAYATTGNGQLATVIGMVTSKQPTAAIGQQLISGALNSGGINPGTYQVAQSAIAAFTGHGSASKGTLAQSAVQGILGSAMMNGGSPINQLSKSGGLTLAKDAMGIMNATRSPVAQIGQRLSVLPKLFGK